MLIYFHKGASRTIHIIAAPWCCGQSPFATGKELQESKEHGRSSNLSLLVSHFRKCSLRQRVRERHALSSTVLEVSNLPLETSKGRLQFKKKKKNQTRVRETQLAGINNSFDINLTLHKQISKCEKQIWGQNCPGPEHHCSKTVEKWVVGGS